MLKFGFMIVEGKKIASVLAEKIQKELSALPEKRVCFVMFGTDPASQQFVALKSKIARDLGVAVSFEHYPEQIENEAAVKIVARIAKEKYDGIVVQLPLPAGLDTALILNQLPKEKDIDVLGAQAKEAFLLGTTTMVPPVAKAVEEIFTEYGISLENKKILIVGRGLLVGEPVAALLAAKKIPFATIDKDTPLQERHDAIRAADIIISGAGVPHLIKPDMVKDGVVLLDAGTSEQGGRLVGDIDPACAQKASLLSPVPGGIGPLTVICLFGNLLA